MRLRTRASIVGAALTFTSTFAAALGLGEIKLNTALNQPLVAEIPLLNVRELSEKEVIVGLATNEEFARVGVDKTYFLTDLDFRVDLDANNGPTLFVTSSQPVNEPFLNFVVQVQWPSGRLLREYTLLVDLPVYTDAGIQPVNQPVQQQPTTRPSRPTQPVPSRPPAAYANTRDGDLIGDDEYGPIGSSDNLWTIATRTKSADVTVHQAMIGIQRANPDAFIRNNINLLKKGKVLRIPDTEELLALSHRDAVNEVARQNTAFRNPDAVSSDSLPQLEGSKSYSPTRTEDTVVEGRVKLTTGTSDTSQGIGSGADAEIEELQGELSLTQEELDAAKRENEELRERARSQEEQIETMEKLIALNNEEMRALELAAAKLNEEQAALEEPVEETDPLESEVEDPIEEAVAIDEPELGIDEDPMMTEDTETEAVEAGVETTEPETAIEQQPAEQKAPEVQVPPVNQVNVPSTPEKGIVELLMDNLLYILIGLGVLIVGVAGVWFSKRESKGFDDDEFDDLEDEPLADSDVGFAPEGDDESTVVAFDEEALPSDDDIEEELNSQDDFDLEPAEAETEDVVAECEIHIAYGQYEQAEEKLISALDTEPANIDMRLKLLEVFAAENKVDAFDEHYAYLNVIGDADASERAANIRENMDGAAPFDASAHDVAAFAALVGASHIASADDSDFGGSDDDNFELDLDLGSDEDKTVIAPPKATDEEDLAALDADLSSDEYDLDLELGEEAGTSDELDVEGLDLELDDSELDLDLDLDLDEDLGDSDQKESVTAEFTDNLVADKPFSQEDYDFDAENAEDESEGSLGDDVGEFDLDADLDNILANEETDETGSLSDAAAESGEDLGDFGDLDLSALDEETDTETDASSSDDSVSELELDAELPSPEKEGDLDEDLDLDGDFDLDGLDQELDQLASGFEGDLDDLDPDIELESKIAESESDLALPEGELPDLEESDLDLGEFAEEAPEQTPEAPVSDTSAKTDSDNDFELPDFDPEEDDDSNLGFLSDNDEVATKLDLARAYIDMGDTDGAKDIIEEIIDEGNDEQKSDAKALLEKI